MTDKLATQEVYLDTTSTDPNIHMTCKRCLGPHSLGNTTGSDVQSPKRHL